MPYNYFSFPIDDRTFLEHTAEHRYALLLLRIYLLIHNSPKETSHTTKLSVSHYVTISFLQIVRCQLQFSSTFKAQWKIIYFDKDILDILIFFLYMKHIYSVRDNMMNIAFLSKASSRRQALRKE